MDWASRPSRMRHLGMYDEHTQSADAPARKILSRGFEAVPELIALLQDRRVTVHDQPAFMNAPARIMRVGELARQLVRQIAGDHAVFPTHGDDTQAILAWWEMVRTQDESVALRRVFSGDREGRYAELTKGWSGSSQRNTRTDSAPYAMSSRHKLSLMHNPMHWLRRLWNQPFQKRHVSRRYPSSQSRAHWNTNAVCCRILPSWTLTPALLCSCPFSISCLRTPRVRTGPVPRLRSATWLFR